MRFNLIKLKSVDSTNNYAIKLLKKKNFSQSIIIANYQTKGRGRSKNKWISLKGNIFMSLVFEINKKYSLQKVTKMNCSIIKSTLKEFTEKQIKIKKPNDLLIDNKKFCGILQETLFLNKKKYIIVGIGINLSQSPKIEGYKTTHFSVFSKKKITKSIIYNSLKNNYENNIERFL